MTIKNVANGVVRPGMKTYNIEFMNSDGAEDETQLDADGIDDLNELFSDFCKENGFNSDKVISITTA